MRNRKRTILRLRFVMLTTLCAITVTSAAVLCQAFFRSDEAQAADAVFTEQNIGETVDLTDALNAVEKKEDAEEQKEARDAAAQKTLQEAAKVQEIDGLTVSVHAQLPVVQPSLTPEQAQDVSIVVKKSDHILTLYNGESIIAQYSVGLGSAADQGAKQQEGDRRTPEGEYYVSGLNGDSKYHLALGLSYPNAQDAQRGLNSGLITQEQYNSILSSLNAGQQPDWYTKLGGQIMIHGQKGNLGGQADWTNGCVAVDNQVMDILWKYCRVGTKVTLLP